MQSGRKNVSDLNGNPNGLTTFRKIRHKIVRKNVRRFAMRVCRQTDGQHDFHQRSAGTRMSLNKKK
jgi:hypothetical protein